MVQDMKSSRGGCRHLVLHDDGTHEWYALNRVQTEWPAGEEGDDDEPDLTFMPAPEVPAKASVQGSRRGLTGLQSMLALSKAAPAKKGTHQAPVVKEEDGEAPEVKPEEAPETSGRVREKEAWLRCGNVECCKWRRVPESVVAALEREKATAAAAALEAKLAADRGDAGAAAAAAARAAPRRRGRAVAPATRRGTRAKQSPSLARRKFPFASPPPSAVKRPSACTPTAPCAATAKRRRRNPSSITAWRVSFPTTSPTWSLSSAATRLATITRGPV